MIERPHILKLLKQAKKAVLNQDILEMKNLSEWTVHSDSI